MDDKKIIVIARTIMRAKFSEITNKWINAADVSFAEDFSGGNIIPAILIIHLGIGASELKTSIRAAEAHSVFALLIAGNGTTELPFRVSGSMNGLNSSSAPNLCEAMVLAKL